MDEKKYLTREQVSVHTGRARRYVQKLAVITCKITNTNNPQQFIPKVTELLEKIQDMLDLLHRGTGSLNEYSCSQCHKFYRKTIPECPRCSNKGELQNG